MGAQGLGGVGEREDHLGLVCDKAAVLVEGAARGRAAEDGLVAARVCARKADEERDERGAEALPARGGRDGDVLDVRDAARAVRELVLDERRRRRDDAPRRALGRAYPFQ